MDVCLLIGARISSPTFELTGHFLFLSGGRRWDVGSRFLKDGDF
jgi:hypothetical protein